MDLILGQHGVIPLCLTHRLDRSKGVLGQIVPSDSEAEDPLERPKVLVGRDWTHGVQVRGEKNRRSRHLSGVLRMQQCAGHDHLSLGCRPPGRQRTVGH